MSLFDILKYQNIDLGNRYELEALPEDLINLYWNEVGNPYPEEESKNFSHIRKCRLLAVWTDDVYTGDNPYKMFVRALKKYNPEG